MSKSDDLISRQAALTALALTAGVGNRALDKIRALPSAQPERKKGEWIEVDDNIISGRCSVCGWEAVLYETDVVGMDFCPNCGADMRGVEE